jgi:hypothetical protein
VQIPLVCFIRRWQVIMDILASAVTATEADSGHGELKLVVDTCISASKSNDSEDDGEFDLDEETELLPSGSKGKWTAAEDELLKNAVSDYGGRNWKKISECLDGRTDVQCLHRWQKVLRPGLIKGPWTKEEDDKVVELVGKYGVKSWSHIARELKGRLGKQCRERWYNHLSPDINKAPWTLEEDTIIVEVNWNKSLLYYMVTSLSFFRNILAKVTSGRKLHGCYLAEPIIRLKTGGIQLYNGYER